MPPPSEGDGGKRRSGGGGGGGAGDPNSGDTEGDAAAAGEAEFEPVHRLREEADREACPELKAIKNLRAALLLVGLGHTAEHRKDKSKACRIYGDSLNLIK